MSTKAATVYRKELKQYILRAHPQKDKGKLKELEDKYWKRICKNPMAHKTKVIDVDEWEKVKLELNNKSKTSKSSFMKYWGERKMKPISSPTPTIPMTPKAKSSPITPPTKRPRLAQVHIRAPAQYQTKQEINAINEEIAKLNDTQQQPYVDINAINKQIANKQSEKKQKLKKLSRLQSSAMSSKKHRIKRRRQILQYSLDHPDDRSCIIKEAPGRPSVEMYYPGFSNIFMDIVNHHCATGSDQQHS